MDLSHLDGINACGEAKPIKLMSKNAYGYFRKHDKSFVKDLSRKIISIIFRGSNVDP